MIGVVMILLAIAFAPGLKSHADTMRNSDNLDCSNSSISDFNKGTCLILDMTSFYFVGTIILLAGGAMVAKKFI